MNFTRLVLFLCALLLISCATSPIDQARTFVGKPVEITRDPSEVFITMGNVSPDVRRRENDRTLYSAKLLSVEKGLLILAPLVESPVPQGNQLSYSSHFSLRHAEIESIRPLSTSEVVVLNAREPSPLVNCDDLGFDWLLTQ